MHAPAHFVSRRLAPSWMMHAWGLGGGLAFTGLIAAGLAYFSLAPPAEPEKEEDEVSAVEIPDPPPPPPPQTMKEGTPLPPAPLIFEEAPSGSTVRLAPTPIPITPLITDTRPSFSLQFDFSPGQFRPGSGNWEPDVNHVFQRSQVDQGAVAVYKKAPTVSSQLMKRVKNPRVRVLCTVNADGSVSNVRLMFGQDPEFDRLVAEAIEQWRFRPAVRKGKKVRQLVELPVYIKAPSSNPFSVN